MIQAPLSNSPESAFLSGPTDAVRAPAPPDPRDEIADHISSLRAFAISLSRNGAVADDLVQDTIVRAWSNIDKFTPGTDLRAWLFTILRNLFYSQRRKAVREVADPDGLHAARLSVRPAHDGRLAFADFRAAFDQLSAEHREVLILVGANGYSCEEAAAMMGVAVGTVKSRTNRARARLCEILQLTGSDDDFAGPDGIALAAASALRLAEG